MEHKNLIKSNSILVRIYKNSRVLTEPFFFSLSQNFQVYTLYGPTAWIWSVLAMTVDILHVRA